MAKMKQMRHKSGLKAHRQSLKHAIHNATLKKSVRLAVRAVMDAAKSKDIKSLSELTGKASAALGKAAVALGAGASRERAGVELALERRAGLAGERQRREIGRAHV